MTTESLLKSYVDKVSKNDGDVDHALTAFKQRDFNGAREFLESAVKADKRLPPADLLLARMFYAANLPREARAALERVSRDHPGDPGPSLIFGELALEGRRIAEAEIALNKASDLARQVKANEHRKKNIQKRVQYGLAGVAEARGDWAGAAKLLRPVVDADPNNVKNVVRLARCLFKNGDHDASLPLLKELWDRDKDSMQRPEIVAALLFAESDDRKKAAELMQLAAQRDSDNEATQRFVGQWALESGDIQLAQRCADKALAASNSSLSSRLLMALVARYKGEYDIARELLESVHLEAPGNFAAVIELAIVLGNIDGMESRAIRYAQLAYRLQPDLRTSTGRNAAIALAWLLHRFGGKPQAEQILQQAISNGSISVESTYFAAIMLQADNPEAAKKLLTAALDSKRVFPNQQHAKDVLKSLQ